MEKNEEKKIDDLKNSRESYYIVLMLKIITVFIIIGVIGFFVYPLFIWTPIYRNDSCLQIHYGYGGSFQSWAQSDKPLYKWFLTAQSTFFIFINWLEIVGMYLVFKGLRKIEMNKLNIKAEIKLAALIWSFFSVFYFICD
jgi:hypothetical protein